VFDLPLESIHPLAFKAAEATRCAQEQGKYWAMHDRLFANQRTLGDWSAHAEGIRSDMAMAQKIGASGTPSFILARTNPNDPTRVTGIAFLRGAQPYGAFKALVERALGTPE
jgi:protein-disulfide isomerase